MTTGRRGRSGVGAFVRPALLALCAWPLGSACSEDKPPLTEEEFCQEYARRECAKIGPACSVTSAACEPVRAAACRDQAHGSKSATRQYTPANAPACLDKVSAVYGKALMAPADLASLDDTCARVFQGTARAAEPCGVDYDCAGDLTCDKSRCGTRKVVAPGAGCANIGESCARGEFCSDDKGVFLCTKRLDKGAACGDSAPCLERFRCAGTCAERLALRAACAAHGECESGYCSPFGKICGPGLNFAYDSASCRGTLGDLASANP